MPFFVPGQRGEPEQAVGREGVLFEWTLPHREATRLTLLGRVEEAAMIGVFEAVAHRLGCQPRAVERVRMRSGLIHVQHRAAERGEIAEEIEDLRTIAAVEMP